MGEAMTLPQGFVLDGPTLPSGFKLDEPEKPRSEQNFFERFGEDLKTRFGEQGSEIIRARVEGDQGFMSTALQLTGKVGAGTVLDLMGELIVSGGRGLSNITPDAIEDPIKGGATAAAMKLLDTDLGQKGLAAAKEGYEKWSEFAEENPVMARNIESVVNIGLLVAPAKGTKPKSSQPGAVGRAGEKLVKSGKKREVVERDAFLFNLVRPKQTPTQLEKEARIARESDSLLNLRSQKIAPTSKQRETMETITRRKIPVNANRSTQKNLNILDDWVGKESTRLASTLEKSKIRYNLDEFNSELDMVLKQFDSPEFGVVLQGNAKEAAKNVVQLAKIAAKDQKPTLSGLLSSRKALDSKLKRLKSNVFNPDTDSAVQIAVREVRNTMNDFIAARAPNVRVKQSLRDQSNVLRTMDDVAKKAADEANNVIFRASQKLIKLLPWRSEFNSLGATLFGVGGLGAAALFAPYFTKLVAAGAVATMGSRLIIRPQTRKSLGQLLKFIDEGIKKSSDPRVITELRADRAAIFELMKQLEDEE